MPAADPLGRQAGLLSGRKAVLGGASCTRRYAVRPEPAHCWILPAALMPNKKEPCGAATPKRLSEKKDAIMIRHLKELCNDF